MANEPTSLADDIVPNQLPAHLQIQRARFLPWHRTRKEYIRRFQWNALTSRKVSTEWRTELRSEPLRCLVIPGDDLLDIRALWRDIHQYQCRIRYLGFNESASSLHEGTRLFIAHNVVTSLPGVATDSLV